MREVLSRKDLTTSLYNLDIEYHINIDEAVRSVFQTRTIIRKYVRTNDIQDKRLINNVIIINNIIGVKLTNYALYHTFDDFEYRYIKAVLIFLNIYDESFGFDVDEDIPLLNLFNDTLSRYNKGLK